MKRKILFLLLLIRSVCFGANDSSVLRFVLHKNLDHASVGLSVIDISNGQTVFCYNDQQSLVPASLMKLLSTATAFQTYGSNYRYKTEFGFSVPPVMGVIDGNLYLQGGGDPSLASEYINVPQNQFFEYVLEVLKREGIQKITGDILPYNNESFETSVSPYWLWQDMGNYYASGYYKLNYKDNTCRISLKSGSVGTLVQVGSVSPNFPSMNFRVLVRAADNNKDSAYVYGMPTQTERYILGSIPANRQEFIIKGDLPNPAQTLAYELRNYLIKNNIQVLERKVEEGENTSLQKRYTYQGADLKQLATITNFRSNNLFAEAFFRSLDSNYNAVEAAETLKQEWRKQGITLPSLQMLDGNGLSPMNKISAADLTQFLYIVSKKDFSKDFQNTLPLVGQQGTVSSLLKDTPLSGKMRLKSGSMMGVRGYAGYVYQQGKTYAITIIVNNYQGTSTELVQAIERLFLSLFP